MLSRNNIHSPGCRSLQRGRSIGMTQPLHQTGYSRSRAIPQRGGIALLAPAGPDLWLEVEGSTVQRVAVFGVKHTDPQPHIGEYILTEKPEVVVVETGINPAHSSVPGNGIDPKEIPVTDDSQAFFVRMFAQVASQIKEHGGDEPVNHPVWDQVRCNYRGEQLAYIAAFTTGAKLIFGDRPKDITYRRLFSIPTVEDYDLAYGDHVCGQYRHLLGLPEAQYTPSSMALAEKIMMQEREAIMCKVLQDACLGSLPEGGLEVPPASISMVVGAGHLKGLENLWKTGQWKEMVGSKDVTQSPLMSAPAAAEEKVPNPFDPAGPGSRPGLRRGMMEAFMTMSVTQEVIQDMASVIGGVQPDEIETVENIMEVYGSCRMMLACLPRELLVQVVSGYKCDFYDELEPIRQVRPSCGGPAQTDAVVTLLRGLNFDIPGAAVAEVEVVAEVEGKVEEGVVGGGAAAGAA
eukprot:gene5965-5248_t